MAAMDAALTAAGYGVIEFNKPNPDDKTDIIYGFHPVGNTGHDIGPSLTTWQPLQSTFTLHLQHLFSFEYFAYTPLPEWGGKKLRIPIEDDAMLMEHGVQFVHPANYRLLVIKRGAAQGLGTGGWGLGHATATNRIAALHRCASAAGKMPRHAA